MNVAVHLGKTDLSEAMRQYIARRLHFSLGRFGARVGRLDVRIAGSPRLHGSRSHCHINAEIVPFGSVTVEESSPDMYTAIDRATTRIGRLFSQELDRMRDMRIDREIIRAA